MYYKKRLLFFLTLLLLAGSLGYPQSIERQPYLQMATENSIVIRWRTDTPTESRVEYGLTPDALVQDVLDAAEKTEHEVELTGLVPATRYFYRVGDADSVLASGAEFTFNTHPPVAVPRPVRVWILGDSGTANGDARDVRDAFVAFNGGPTPDVFMMLGDNAYDDGTDDEYQAAVFDMYTDTLSSSALWPTLGNHDAENAWSATQTGVYYDIFTLPKWGEAGGLASATEAYYSFDYANIHFVCLDSHDSDRSVGGPMLTWLENDLASTTQRWVVAFWHHPPYTKGSHDSDDYSDGDGRHFDMRENVLPILDAYGVDMVLGGHSHSYERSYPLYGHYGTSETLTPDMILDDGDGYIHGDGVYSKDDIGTVYIVAGSSGKRGNIFGRGSLDHPAMVVSRWKLGSVVLDVDGDEMTTRFLDDSGDVEDEFTIVKSAPANIPPSVDAGQDFAAVALETVPIQGVVSDDGMPVDPGVTVVDWSTVEGPAAMFGDPQSVATNVVFPTEGTYVLRLTADDGELSTSDTVEILVFPEGTTNQAPVVNAGPDASITLPAPLPLQGVVADDGLPTHSPVSAQWSAVSGPGTVTFGDPSAPGTTASFDLAGSYVLRLVADDGELVAVDDVVVAVEPGTVETVAHIASGDDDAEEDDDGEVELDDDDIKIANDDGDVIAAFRFAVELERGARITNAYLQFESDDDDDEPTVVTIRAQASDHAPAFTDEDEDISSRPLTDASVVWNVVAWPEEEDRGPAQRSPNLAPILQEILARDGWQSGNAVVFTLTGVGDRSVESADEDSESAPTLHIEYVVGAPEPPQDTFVAGVGRADITPSPGIPMFGWSLIGEVANGVRTRLYARALYLESEDGAKLALVQTDLGGIPAALHREVTAAVAQSTGLSPAEVLISATHTHSAPGVFFGTPFYNQFGSSESGYDPRILRFVSEGIESAILQAFHSRDAAVVASGEADVFGLSRNRSIEAYRANPNPLLRGPDNLTEEERSIDPTLTMIRVDRVGVGGNTTPIAAYSTFAIHGTAVPPSADLYNGDVHAAAERFMEWDVRRKFGLTDSDEFVFLLANGAEGDSAPAFNPDERSDSAPFDEAHRIGRELATASFELFGTLEPELGVPSRLSAGFEELSLEGAPVCGDDPTVGVPTMAGSEEGGTSPVAFLGAYEGNRRDEPVGCQGFKKPAFFIPGIEDFFHDLVVDRDAFPQWLSIQVLRVGDVVLATVPGEITTEMARRIENAVHDAVRAEDPTIRDVAVVGLANQFISYITTHEEYDQQHYEGGSTIFGPNTGQYLLDGLVALSVDSLTSNVYRPLGIAFPEQDTDEILPSHEAFESSREALAPPEVPDVDDAGRLTASFRWRDMRPGTLEFGDSLVRIETRDESGSWVPFRIGGIPVDDRGLDIEIRHEDDLDDGAARWLTRWYIGETSPAGEFRFAIAGRGEHSPLHSAPFTLAHAGSTPPTEQIAALAPILSLHPDESYCPMAPEAFIAQSRFRHHRQFADDEGYNTATGDWVKTNSRDSEYYNVPVSVIAEFTMNPDGTNRRPRDPDNGSDFNVFLQPDGKPAGNCQPSGVVPTYYYVTTRPDATLVSYWWFYGYNQSDIHGSHQGDWEHVTLALNPIDSSLRGAWLARHGGGAYHPASELELRDGRPVIYSALGTHASYASTGHHRVGFDDTAEGGASLRSAESLLPLDAQPWREFAGAWGEVGTFPWTTGPLGPWQKRDKDKSHDRIP